MTSIVVLLYFKQENCEILISLYNWGWMKHCQSRLVSYKVEWFCSLAGFSWWSGLFLFFSFSLSLSLQMLFPAGLFFWLIPFLKSREKALVERAWRWGLHYYRQLQLSAYILNTCCSSRKPADFTTSTLFDCRTIHSLHLLVLCYYIYSFSYLHSAKRKKRNISSLCFIKQSTNRNACLLITLSVWSNEDMLWDCLFRIHRYGSKSLHID